MSDAADDPEAVVKRDLSFLQLTIPSLGLLCDSVAEVAIDSVTVSIVASQEVLASIP